MSFRINSAMALVLMLLLVGRPACGGHLETNGDVLVVLIPGAAYASTFYLDDKPGRYQFYKSFFAASLSTHALKSMAGKTRPDGSDNRSFPSGHTSASFQGAAFIHRRYGVRRAILPYLASAYVGYTRVEANKHDWTDVTAGAALGIASSWWLTTARPDQQVSVYADGNKLGIRFSMQL